MTIWGLGTAIISLSSREPAQGRGQCGAQAEENGGKKWGTRWLKMSHWMSQPQNWPPSFPVDGLNNCTSRWGWGFLFYRQKFLPDKSTHILTGDPLSELPAEKWPPFLVLPWDEVVKEVSRFPLQLRFYKLCKYWQVPSSFDVSFPHLENGNNNSSHNTTTQGCCND